MVLLRPILAPGETGPHVVAVLHRNAGGPWVRLEREAGESSAAFLGRAEAGAVVVLPDNGRDAPELGGMDPCTRGTNPALGVP
ncbi:hypothetical protein Rumeso_02630 [Rubellimicrobium mesophilum DSM 19309]|uniref:Uncharacterized protein n=1 Tax=Rubellimicrobium mesophilum DSM 19309 TaxID=442562 RepID=A0A017HNV0_9RHOB|nr:hypothetical protein Rumeso_02630 [Rubellimicrobium mesophilum DSM 19309]